MTIIHRWAGESYSQRLGRCCNHRSLSLFNIWLHSIPTVLQYLHPLGLRDSNIFWVASYRIWAAGLECIEVLQMLVSSSSLFYDMYHSTPRASWLHWSSFSSTSSALTLSKAAAKCSSHSVASLLQILISQRRRSYANRAGQWFRYLATYTSDLSNG